MSLGPPVVAITCKHLPVIDNGLRVIEEHHSSVNEVIVMRKSILVHGCRPGSSPPAFKQLR